MVMKKINKIIYVMRDINYCFWAVPIFLLGAYLYLTQASWIGKFLIIFIGLLLPFLELYPNIIEWFEKNDSNKKIS